MFQFKQFAISDQNTAMKIGTDGILLGSWVDCTQANEILDIGTGTGVIAIMCAQKNQHATITALELDEGAVKDANHNVENCPWSNRIQVVHTSLQLFEQETEKKYDCIISNPPFFENSQKANNEGRLKARHTDTLHYTDLMRYAERHLTEKGMLSLILPTEQGYQCIEKSMGFNLSPIRICKVHPIPSKPAHRILISLTRSADNLTLEETQLIIETGVVRHEYTTDYQRVCKDFYLKF
jgi:tRNA1Val (adenine37-N6)-methyltransferase